MVNSLWYGISKYRAKRSENTALRLVYMVMRLGLVPSALLELFEIQLHSFELSAVKRVTLIRGFKSTLPLTSCCRSFWQPRTGASRRPAAASARSPPTRPVGTRERASEVLRQPLTTAGRGSRPPSSRTPRNPEARFDVVKKSSINIVGWHKTKRQAQQCLTAQRRLKKAKILSPDNHSNK